MYEIDKLKIGIEHIINYQVISHQELTPKPSLNDEINT